MQLALDAARLVRDVTRAREEARELHAKSKRLFSLLQSVEEVLTPESPSVGLVPSSQETARTRITETVKESLNSCRRCLEKIEKRFISLISANQGSSGQIVQKVHLTLSKNTIQKLERAVETHIQAISTLIILLQLHKQTDAQEKLEQLQHSVQGAIRHLDYIRATISSSQLPVPEDQHSNVFYAQDDRDAEYEGIELLEKCINTAQSVHPGCSTMPPDAMSLQRMNSYIAVEDNDDERSGLVEEEAAVLPTIEEDDLPLDIIACEMNGYIRAAGEAFDAGNFLTAEGHQHRAISCGKRLEQRGYRSFSDLNHMSKRLVDIYVKQGKHTAAVAEISKLLSDTAANGASSQDIVEQAELGCLQAEVMYSISQKERHCKPEMAEKYRDMAERTVKQRFTSLYDLRDQASVSDQKPVLLDCVRLIVRIFEDRGETVRAMTWRERFLQPERSPLSPLASNPDDPLTDCILSNLADAFQELLDGGADIERECKRGLTPIMHAAGCQHTQECFCTMAIGKLADRGASLDAADEMGRTALHLAVLRENQPIVRMLLERGADIYASAPDTPLAMAVKQNRKSMVECILDTRVHEDIAGQDGWGLVHHAVRNESADALDALLSRRHTERIKLDLDARCGQGKSALMYVAERASVQSYECARKLLHHGADVNAKEINGDSKRSVLCFVVHYAPNAKRIDLANLLARHGASLEYTQQRQPRNFAKYTELQVSISARLPPRRNSAKSSSSSTRSGSSAGTMTSLSTAATTATAMTEATTATATTTMTKKESKRSSISRLSPFSRSKNR